MDSVLLARVVLLHSLKTLGRAGAGGDRVEAETDTGVKWARGGVGFAEGKQAQACGWAATEGSGLQRLQESREGQGGEGLAKAGRMA